MTKPAGPPAESEQTDVKMTGFATPAGDKAYFFLGSHYVRYNVVDGADGVAEGVEPGYPLAISEGWPALPFTSDIDACLSWSDGSVFFFRGDQCVEYDVANDVVLNGPVAISELWPGVFADGIDSAVLLSDAMVHFFRGGEVVTWNAGDGSGATGGPQAISSVWNGLPEPVVNVVRWWATEDVYFFSDSQYWSYDFASAAPYPEYPAEIAGNWTGLPFEDRDAGPQPGPGPGPVPVVSDGTPARAMSVDDARAELQALMDAGEILWAASQLPGRVDLDGLIPFSGGQKQDGNVAGVVIRYNAGGLKSPNAPDRLDPRNALALVRFCRWLSQTWGVTELHHLGIDGNDPATRNDCHGQGRAVDFSGVAGTKDGTPYTLSVLKDWGTVSTPSTPGGTWQPLGTKEVHFRLDDAPGKEFARDFFRSAYAFITSQWQDRSANPDGPAEPTTIGNGSFVMNPDHPSSNPAPDAKNGREAHNNHLHMQIGVTGTA